MRFTFLGAMLALAAVVALAGSVAPAQAASRTISFEDFFTGGEFPNTPQPPVSFDTVTFEGGSRHSALNGLPANDTSVYATSHVCCSSTISIRFFSPVADFSLEVYNMVVGATSDEDVVYTVQADTGAKAVTVLKGLGGESFERIALHGAGITTVTITSNRDNFVFAIDNVRFTEGPPEEVFVDSIGDVPSGFFSVFGAGGPSVFAEQSFGPSFTLTQPTTITEVGAFANNCRSIIAGVPLCPDTRPFVVDIRPDEGGVPDPDVVLASFELSHDDDPLYFRYESANPKLALPPGRYYAILRAQGDDAGSVLASAVDPFPYQAAEVETGDRIGDRWLTSRHRAAFRILGVTAAAAAEIHVFGETRLLPDGDVIVLDPFGRGHRLRADPAIAAQLAALAGRTMTVVGTAVEDPSAEPHYPINVHDFRVEPGGAFDGQGVFVAGATARLPDGDVIVFDAFGRGHRLRGTGEIRTRIESLAGKRVEVAGSADVTNTASRLNWPIDVTSIVEA